jgi:subtilase family serine protease
VASAVLTITGLDTATHKMTPAGTLPPPGPNYWVAPGCSTYYGQKIASNEPSAYHAKQPWTNCGYTPRQIRGAYGVSQSGMTGKGVTVAIVDAYASPTILRDANEYAKVTGDKPLRFHRGRLARPVHPVLLGVYELPEPTWTALMNSVWTGWAHICDVSGR